MNGYEEKESLFTENKRKGKGTITVYLILLSIDDHA